LLAGDSGGFKKANEGSKGGDAAKANATGAADMATVFNTLATLPQFTIAMAQGPAMGGGKASVMVILVLILIATVGVGLLSMCDMTIAVESSWFSLSEVSFETRCGIQHASLIRVSTLGQVRRHSSYYQPIRGRKDRRRQCQKAIVWTFEI